MWCIIEEITIMIDTLYLYNPLSNDGMAKKHWEMLIHKFPQIAQNAFAVNEISNLSTFLKGHPCKTLVIAGGDGTINTVCQAVLSLPKKPTLAILPLGFGNALASCFGVETAEKAMAAILHPVYKVTIDVMKTNLAKSPLGMFNISAGFDARIVHTRHKYRYIGFRSYSLSAFRSIIFHPDSDMKITVDNRVTLSALASSLMIAKSPIIGINYHVAPEAKLNDGLLDCTIFSTKFAYLTNLRLRGFKHPLYSRLGKVHFKASHIRIEGEPYLQIDGDPEEQREGLEISIMKKQLTFLYNKDILKNSEIKAFKV